MANLFKSIMNRSDEDEELDLEFDIHEAESNCFELPPDKENNQVLAVWGSPSSGKTTMSVKLARYIASQKKNVILVLADMTAPPLPYICPPSDLEDENSLGAILGAAHVTGNLIKQNAILHKRNEYLTMLAMKNGENAFSYPPFTETQAQELLSELRRMADYIIIDCTSNITNDVLSAVSLIESDAVLRLVSCDLKSISYLNSQLPLLLDNKFNANNPDLTAAILDMKQHIDNEVFHEWCDSLILCQNDRSLKSTLTPIVNKLSDMRVVNADLEYMVTGPRKEFITMALLVIGNIPLLYMLNKAWYNSLMNTIPGQIILAVSAVGIFVAAAIVIKLTKPIEYKR